MQKQCPDCAAPGILLSGNGKCAKCYGGGRVGTIADDVAGGKWFCPICHGSGKCQTCGGTGLVASDREPQRPHADAELNPFDDKIAIKTVCPKCGALDWFEWKFLGKLTDPVCQHTWYVGSGIYILQQSRAIFQAGNRFARYMTSGISGQGAWVGKIVGWFCGMVFGIAFRLEGAILMIPVQATVGLCQDRTKTATVGRYVVISIFILLVGFGAYAIRSNLSAETRPTGTAGIAQQNNAPSNYPTAIQKQPPVSVAQAPEVNLPLTQSQTVIAESHSTAQSSTVNVSQNQLPVSSLTVRTDPGASVGIDGRSRVTVGPDGLVTLSNLEPGQHQLAVDKPLFEPVLQSLNLKSSENTTVNIALERVVGFLTVNTNTPDAKIRVSGGPAQNGRILRMPVPVGQATIDVTGPLRKTVSQTVSIEPGKEATVSVSLDLDSEALAAMANQIQVSFQLKRYEAALEQAGRYLQVGARDKDVLGVVALSYLQLNRYGEFRSSAREALAAGATLRFALQHIHLGINVAMHPAVLELNSETLRFQPEGKCNFDSFEVPLGQVRVGNRSNALLSFNERTWSINVNVPNPSNPKKEAALNFTTLRNQQAEIDAIREILATR